MGNLFKVPIKFIRLAPKESAIILFSSIILGFLQSFTAFIFLPLSDVLGIEVGNNNKVILIIKNIFEQLGLKYNIGSILISMVLFISAISMINFFTKAYSARISAKLIKDLRMKSISSVINAKWSYFTSKKSGEFINTIITEAGKSAAGYVDSINFFSALIQALVMMASAFFIDFRIALFSVISGIFILFIFKRWVKKAGVAGAESHELMKSITEKISDGMSGIKPLKSMNRDHLLEPLIRKETIKLESNQYRLFIVSAIPQIFREPIIMVFIVAGIFYITIKSIVPLSSLIPLVLLFQKTTQQFGVTQGTFQAIKKMEPFLESMDKNISSAVLEKEENFGKLNANFKSGIKFKNVSFSYGDKSILKNVNLSIRKNQFVVIIGPSGSGKTTLLDLLCGLSTPDSGNIIIDNTDLSNIDIKKWRSNIGYIPQDLFLFNNTIANNISLGDSKIKQSEIIKAIERAGASEFVSELKDSMNTNIGEKGLKLSGGQRQRLSIARAIVSNPKLLLLDEATTALDPKTEEKILDTLRSLTEKGMTIVAVSHQPAILKIADTAYKLEDGKLVEQAK